MTRAGRSLTVTDDRTLFVDMTGATRTGMIAEAMVAAMEAIPAGRLGDDVVVLKLEGGWRDAMPVAVRDDVTRRYAEALGLDGDWRPDIDLDGVPFVVSRRHEGVFTISRHKGPDQVALCWTRRRAGGRGGPAPLRVVSARRGDGALSEAVVHTWHPMPDGRWVEAVLAAIDLLPGMDEPCDGAGWEARRAVLLAPPAEVGGMGGDHA